MPDLSPTNIGKMGVEELMEERVLAGPREYPRNPLFYQGLYAPSGFDLMSILIRVATRPNPRINLGAIDSNCALVLCDMLAVDAPIVYCSQGFETLTGYHREEVLGRNCRFLQSPTGLSHPRLEQLPASHNLSDNNDEEANASRIDSHTTDIYQELSVDDQNQKSLAELKSSLIRKEETQITLVNYKKGGSKFTNVLTTIPVCLGTNSEQFRYVVGFQADRSSFF